MSPRRLTPLAVATACAVLPAAAHGAIGSAGLGDPLFPKAGNGGYDVSHYDLYLKYAPRKNRLVGEAEITATATIDLDRFNLDLRKRMEVGKAHLGEAPARFEQAGRELVITPPARIASGSEFTVRVDYRGTPKPITDPDGSKEGWVPTGDGSFAPNEPQGSPSWYPCNDYPTDKAAFTIAISVPKGLKAISNGVLRRKVRSAKRTTWVWEQSEPMATYLATVATGKFDLTRSKTGPAPAIYAVDPAIKRRASNPKKASRPLLSSQKIARWLVGRFSPYPFSALGGIVDRVPEIPYALESQTRPIYTRLPDTGLVVHEIAHQWFGNSVTLSSWPDIWLNEGFATFSEWLYSEDHDGPTTAKIFERLYKRPARKKGLWRPAPGNPGKAKHLFADSIYERGAMTLQALRDRIGDDAFFATLRAWVTEYAYGNATTDDFIALAERESGRELDELFRVWLYEPGKPRDW